MAWYDRYTDQEMRVICQAHNSRVIDHKQARDMLGAPSTAAFRGYKGRWFADVGTLEEEGPEPEERPDLFAKRFVPDPIVVDGDWIIVGDVHVPTTNYEFAMLTLVVAKKYGIRNLWIAGDMYNMDAYSRYEKELPDAEYEAEIRAARHLFEVWQSWFTRIVVTSGNHEARVYKRTNGDYRLRTLVFNTLGKIDDSLTISDLGWGLIETRHGTWRVTHPKSYRKSPLSTINDIAMNKGQHVIGWHEHHLSKGLSQNGEYVIINGGGLFDSSNMAYVRLFDGTSREMCNGFVMLKNGVAHVLGQEPFTDWTFLDEWED